MQREQQPAAAAQQPARVAAPAPLALPQLAPPGKFDFSNVNEWPKWMKRFERYRMASGLNTQSKEFQVNAFMYAAGDDAEDVMNMLTLTEVQKRSYKDVTEAIEKHCVSKRNVIYERARFNRRVQEPGKSVESFLTAVHALAEYCEFGTLGEQLIRDRIVVGIRDAKLSENLQLDAKLTLESAMTKVRQSEAVKRQQPAMRGTEPMAGNVEAIHKRQSRRPAREKGLVKDQTVTGQATANVMRSADGVTKRATSPRNANPKVEFTTSQRNTQTAWRERITFSWKKWHQGEIASGMNCCS